jgi:hypothetical protein
MNKSVKCNRCKESMYAYACGINNECEIPVRKILKTVGVQPLLDHKSGKSSSMHWLLFMKIPH